jgi:voltage-gated potassium channel
MTLFEAEGAGSVRAGGDALRWAIATVTPVGSGDATPETAEGRAVAASPMAVGIAPFGVLTAGVAADFVEGAGERAPRAQQQEVRARLAAIEVGLEEQGRLRARRAAERDEPPRAG